MVTLRHVRKAGAHSNQETQPCDTSSSRPTVAPDSQPPSTGRKRKQRIPSPEQQYSQQAQYRRRSKRRRTSDSSWDRAERSYWDSLSRLWLASDALREIDRRNALLAADSSQKVNELVLTKDIEQFARHGGPDLSDIRQYPNCFGSSTVSGPMPSRGEKKSSGRTRSDGTEKSRRSSAYTPNFAQALVDSGVSLVNRSQKSANHREWNEVLIQRRPSLSPSRMFDGHYDRFVKAIDGAGNEDEVMSHVFPKIVGEPRYPSRQNVQLGNLDPIADNIVVPQPDYYEGELPGPGNRQLRKQLEKSIVPSTRTHYPIMPNFFAEAKGPDGTLAVAQRQACHDGALGARAMHRVENLGRRGEIFDNNARTASAIYSGAGNLDLFTHHISQRMGPGTLPQTHMTQLRSFNLADTPGTFRQGVGAFRNASDYARQHRKDAIEDAHRRTGIITPQPITNTPMSARKPLSCQAPVIESSDSDSSSASEEESDNGDYAKSSKTLPKAKVQKPKVVTATPKRFARRDPSLQGGSFGQEEEVAALKSVGRYQASVQTHVR